MAFTFCNKNAKHFSENNHLIHVRQPDFLILHIFAKNHWHDHKHPQKAFSRINASTPLGGAI